MSVLSDFCPPVLRGDDLFNEVFIETGVCDGKTMRCAIKKPFSKLYGIDHVCREMPPEVDREIRAGRVRIIQGSTPDILPKVINPKAPTTFWLDAHYMATAGEPVDPKWGQCPLIHELICIFSVNWAVRPKIVIDDIWQVGTNLWWRGDLCDPKMNRSQWPTFNDIMDQFWKSPYREEYVHTLHQGILYSV